jgi:phosphatidylglycerophosphate synthase
MTEWIPHDLPWQLNAAIWIALGLIEVVLILTIPKRVLARVSQWPFLSPNWITFWRFPIFWFGTYIHFRVDPFGGYQIVVAACALDRVDGKMAVAMREHGIPRSLRDLKRGEWLDPFVDKVTLLPLMILLASKGAINLWLATTIAVADGIGTLLREPFRLGARLSKRLVSHIKLKKSTRASAAGKIKALLQAFSLVTCVPFELGWVRLVTVPNVLAGLALFFGLVSLLSRFSLGGGVDVTSESVDSLFSHRDL